MEVILYCTAYIIGVLLGSFFTLAIYRLPLKQDITHTRSYCPKCNHKLNFFDLIPVLSYVFLKGKCRYCKEKISSRYIIIELVSGIVYLLFVMSLKINIYNISIAIFVQLILASILISFLFIIAGIAKENHRVPTSVKVLGVTTLVIYITYLYIFNLSVHRYIIYLSILMSIAITIFMKIVNDKKTNLIFIECFSLVIFFIINNFYFL